MCPARQPTVIIADNYEDPRRLCGRARDCGFPTVAVYTHLSGEALDSTLAAGYDYLVPQPFDFDRLSELLGRLVPDSPVGPAPFRGYECVESRNPRGRP